MSIRRILLLVLAGIIVVFFGFYLWTNSLNAHKLAVRSIGDKGIYVGAESKAFPATHKHEDDLRAIDKFWELIRSGNEFYKLGKYEEAIADYKRAGEVYPQDRLFAWKQLIKIYEETGQYDKALAVVDEILKTERLVQYGIDQYTTIRARLLAAIASAEPHSESVEPAPK